MVGFQYAEKLPAHRAFGKRPGGWGEGQIVRTGDEVRDLELWWTTSNSVNDKSRATWQLGIPLQFVHGVKLVTQNVKVLWLEDTAHMINKRMAKDDLPGHEKYGGQGWYITGHVSTVDIGASWLPAKGSVAPTSVDDLDSPDTVAVIGVSLHGMEKGQKIVDSRMFKPGDDALKVTVAFFREKDACPLIAAVAGFLEAPAPLACLHPIDMLNCRKVLPSTQPCILGVLTDWTPVRMHMNDWYQFGACLLDGRRVRDASPRPARQMRACLPDSHAFAALIGRARARRSGDRSDRPPISGSSGPRTQGLAGRG
jgi:hypothetical protein